MGGAAKGVASLAGAGEDEGGEGGEAYEDEEVEGAFLKGKGNGEESAKASSTGGARKGALALDEDYDDE